MGLQSIILLILGLVVGGLAGAAIGYYLYRYLSETKVKSAKVQAEEIVQNAERTANQFRAQAELQTKEENVRLREEIENEAEGRRKDLRRQEERLQRRQEALDRKMEDLESRDRNMQKRQKSLEKRTADLDKLEAQHQKELERVSSLSSDEAKELLLESVRGETRQDMARVIREVESEANLEADRRARKLIVMAIQRIASEQVAEKMCIRDRGRSPRARRRSVCT